MNRTHLRSVSTALLFLALGACGDSAPPADGPPASEAPTATAADPSLEYARSLGVPNAREPISGILTAGQPGPGQLQALAEAGYGTAISLRPAGESGAGWEEGAEGQLGLDFHRIPVAGAGDLSRETVEELDRLLAEAGDGPTVLYCASSNRVGALLALRAHWLQGMDPAEALELGRQAGMTRLEPVVAEILGAGGA